MKDTVRKSCTVRQAPPLFIAQISFPVAMTVGAAVFTAASTNVGRTARNRQEQQAYLTGSPAVRLLEEDLREAAFCVQPLNH